MAAHLIHNARHLLGTNELQSMVARRMSSLKTPPISFQQTKRFHRHQQHSGTDWKSCWRAGLRQGNGELILVDLKQSKMDVLTKPICAPCQSTWTIGAAKENSNPETSKPTVAVRDFVSSAKGRQFQIQWQKWIRISDTAQSRG